ncbi:MAG: TrkA family potassium uptake protein [Candidatus Sericytochromatia bacterium]
MQTPDSSLPSIAVIGFSNAAYRTVCRLAEKGAGVLFVIGEGDRHQLTELPAGVLLETVPHLRPGNLPARVGDCLAAVVATEDEQFNIHMMMLLNSRFEGMRIVTRLFNLALGREIEARFPHVTVLSVSDLAAPFFVAAAFAEGVLDAWREPSSLMASVSRQGKPETIAISQEPGGQKLQVRRRLYPAFPVQTKPDLLLLGVLGVLALVIAGGTLFFSYFHGMPPGDALYFVVTTLTTTGYGDYSLKDLPFSAKLVGMTLMLAGASLFAILFALLTDKLFRIRLDVLLGRRRVRKAGHVIVCGAGDVGIRLVECLMLTGADIVVVEREADGRFNQQIRDAGIPMIISDAALQETLERAGAARARILLCATDHDMSNLETALNGRALNPGLRIVVRVYDRDFAEQMRDNFGLDVALSSSAIAANTFAAAAMGEQRE